MQVPAATFQKALELGARSEKDKQAEPLKVKRSPGILLTTFSHSGGLWGALLALNQARPVELFDKFDVQRWADAVERGQVKAANLVPRSEEHTSELQSLMRISYAVFCLKKKK